MSKYNFHDLRIQYNTFNFHTRDVPLPIDCNAFAEKAAINLKSEPLLKMLTDAREKKWFGEAIYLEGGIIKAKFEVHNGIITQFHLYRRYDDQTFFQHSVFNETVDMRKHNRETGKEQHKQTVSHTANENKTIETKEVT